MDRAANHMDGSRHKNNCHWFVNGQERGVQSGQAYKGQTPNRITWLKTLSRFMSINKHKTMVSEYIAQQEAQQEATQQTINENELAV